MEKYALITGASGGIGCATAIQLAEKGWNLYLQYFQNETKIKKLLKFLEKFSVEVIPIQADLTKTHGVDRIVNSVFGIDAFIHCAGLSPYGLFVNVKEEEIDQMFQLHVKSPMVICQKLLPKLMRNEQSNIVIISSIWGQTGAACEVVYSTMKGAQISFVKSLSKELARSGVRVNAVAPGAVQTEMLAYFNEDEIEQLEEDIPMGRLAKPEEIASVIKFLLSQKASYITGQVIAVNGGWYT